MDLVLRAHRALPQTMSLTKLQLSIASPPTFRLHPSSCHPGMMANFQVLPGRSYSRDNTIFVSFRHENMGFYHFSARAA